MGAVYDDTFPTCEHPTQTSFTWCLDAFCFSTCTDSAPPVDSLICFSNQSTQLDVTAPGCITRSAGIAVGGTSTAEQCGTSQATPHVAGLAALIRGVDPSLTPADVRQIIRDGAIDLGPAGFDNGFGWGRIDVINSLQLVAPAPGCTADAECSDGLACNGAETCVAGTCQAGAPLDCNDAIDCTADSCVDPVGTCSNIADDGLCDDADACTMDACDVGAGGCTFSAISPCCGDGVCEVGEDCNTCAADCFSGSAVPPACGNGICEAFAEENCKECPQDCAGTRDGPFCCGDGTRGTPVPCTDPQCNEGGLTCSDVPGSASCCGDGLCEGTEDNINCAVDCGAPAVCGDLFCDPGEDQCNCDIDCGTAPATETSCTDGSDNDCDGFTDCDDADCNADPACAACRPKGDPCTTGAECCDGRCRLKKGAMICD